MSARFKGFPCPYCRGVRLVVTKTRLAAPDLIVRYHRCTACKEISKTETVPRQNKRRKILS